MKTLLSIPTKGDHCTMKGGIKLRQREDGSYVVHYFNDYEFDGHDHFQGGYHNKLSDALKEMARRVERAEGYDLGGSLDVEKLMEVAK